MSSLLETFVLLFESDSTPIKKSSEEVQKTTNALETNLKKTGSGIQASFQNMITQAGGALLALASVGSLIAGMRNAAQFADRLDELSKALDINTEDLSAWGDAVRLNGGSAESFQDTVKGLTASLADFATKGTSRTAPFFKELGIKMVDIRGKARNVIDVLPEIAEQFSKLSKAESFGIGQKMGLDQGTIMLLQRGRREVEDVIKRHKELGVVTKQDAEIAADFNDQWDYTAIAFRSLFTAVNAFVLPPLTSILKLFEKLAAFFRRHTDLIIGGMIALGTAITVFVLPAIKAMVISFAPFLLIGAAIAGFVAIFALLYDDVMNFYAGNKSVLGFLIQKWPVVGQILKFVENEVKGVIKIFKLLGSTVIEVWQFIISIISKAINLIGKNIDKLVQGFNKVKSFLGLGDTKATVTVKNTNDALSLASRTPLNNITSNSLSNQSRVSNKNTNVSVGEVTVNTAATDSRGISQNIGGDLMTQIRQASANFDDGVAA